MSFHAPSSRFNAKVLCCLALVLVTATAGATPRKSGQSDLGVVSGTVVDPSGAPVAGAKVMLINQVDLRVVRTVVTDEQGVYAFDRVTPGVYSVRATKEKLAEYTIKDIRIDAGATAAQEPVTLGPIEELITREPLVELNKSERGGNFTSAQIEALPLGGTTDVRTFDQLALLLPGVSQAPLTFGVRGPGVGFGAGQFSVNGARARSNNFTIDGSDNNDPDVGLRRQGFVALVPQSIESVQTFQVSTLLWDAESGRNVGAQVNAVSKSGGNEFHGQLYSFFTDSSLNARNTFDYTGGASGDEDSFTRLQSGLIFGGPLVKDRTQFFVGFEHLDINASLEQHFATPPSSIRNFLGLRQFSLAQEGFQVSNGVTPLGANLFSLYPLPNNPGGPYGDSTFSEVLPASGHGSIFSAKVSHRVNPSNNLDVRYNFLDDRRILPSFNQAIRSSLVAESQTHNISFILATDVSPTMTNGARFSFGRKTLDFPELSTSPFVFSSTTVVGVPVEGGGVEGQLSTTGPIGQLLVEPYSPIGVDVYLFPQTSANNTYQVADTFSWTRGKHGLKFGGDYRRIQLNSLQDRNYRPLVIFGSGQFRVLDANQRPLFTDLLRGTDLASIGVPTQILQTITAGVADSTIGLRINEVNFFVADNWRARKNLVIEAGLRYEFNTVPREVNKRIERALDLEGLSSFDSSRLVNELGGSSPLLRTTFDAILAEYRDALAGRTRIYDDDGDNFGPRIGVAWDPRGDGRTSVRAGYGVYFDAILGAVVSQSRNVVPADIPYSAFGLGGAFNLSSLANLDVRSGSGNSILNFVRPGSLNEFGGNPEDLAIAIALLNLSFGSNRGGGLAFTLPARDLRSPYAQQWHLSVEHEIFTDYVVSAAYVGSKGTKLIRLTTPNLGPNITPSLPIVIDSGSGVPVLLNDEGSLQTLNSPRPSPNIGAIELFESTAASSYHALQLEARRRFAAGYSFAVSYTWSHAIDDVSDVLPIAGASILPQDSFDLRAERADANFDVRHRFSASGIWDLPFLRHRTDRIGNLFGGWQVATLAQINSGQPYTLRLPIDVNFDGNLTDRPATTDGLLFFDGHGSHRVEAARDLRNFFVLGADGAVGRNTVRGDGYFDWDMTLNKEFRFTDVRRLDFRAEVFNILNRSNFGLPIRTLDAPGFGNSIDTVSPARIIQFALKYSF